MSVQSNQLEQLLTLIPDPALAEQIRTRYYDGIREQAHIVQSRLGHLELDLREQLRQTLGETNTMIADVLAVARSVRAEQSEQGAAVTALRAEFREIGESVSGLRTDVDDLKVRDSWQYNESRQDRAELRARQDMSDAEIASLRVALAAAQAEIVELKLALAAHPSPEQAQATYDGVQRILEHLGLALDDQEATV